MARYNPGIKPNNEQPVQRNNHAPSRPRPPSAPGMPLNPQAQTVASRLAGAVAEAAKSSPQLALEGFTSFMVPEKNIPTTLDLKPSILDNLLSHDVKESQSEATIMIAGQP